jgi:hypothetical protein
MAVTVDTQGRVYVAGYTYSLDFLPLQDPIQSELVSDTDADTFLSVIEPSGTEASLSTYLGTTGSDGAVSIAIGPGPDGTDIYVAGNAGDGVTATGNAFQPAFGGGDDDAFLLRITPPPPPEVPKLSIADVLVAEGNDGKTPSTFTVSMQPATTRTVTVDFRTTDGSALVAQPDYEAASGKLTFRPGETSQSFNVEVVGDTAPEDDEAFFLTLANPVNAALVDGGALGIILDDDAGPLSRVPPPPDNTGLRGPGNQRPGDPSAAPQSPPSPGQAQGPLQAQSQTQAPTQGSGSTQLETPVQVQANVPPPVQAQVPAASPAVVPAVPPAPTAAAQPQPPAPPIQAPSAPVIQAVPSPPHQVAPLVYHETEVERAANPESYMAVAREQSSLPAASLMAGGSAALLMFALGLAEVRRRRAMTAPQIAMVSGSRRSRSWRPH